MKINKKHIGVGVIWPNMKPGVFPLTNIIIKLKIYTIMSEQGHFY